jgi:hypothetical protein
MRSKLEARWAIFFTELNLKWRYEPEKFYGKGRVYTPDFYIEGFGCVEIKPTLALFIKESAEKVKAIASSHPSIKIYGFFAGRVEIGETVLYEGDHLFSPEPRHIYRLLSRARKDFSALSVEAQNADIKRAMQIANATKFDEWRSTKDELLAVIDSLEKMYNDASNPSTVAATTTSP